MPINPTETTQGERFTPEARFELEVPAPTVPVVAGAPCGRHNAHQRTVFLAGTATASSYGASETCGGSSGAASPTRAGRRGGTAARDAARKSGDTQLAQMFGEAFGWTT